MIDETEWSPDIYEQAAQYADDEIRERAVRDGTRR
jgi:hypothetical protein